MTYHRFFCAPATLLVLLCFGCSQHRLVSQRELMDEMAKLAPGNHLSVYDRSGVEHKGILLEPAIIQPDSTQVLVIETVPDKEKYRFGIPLQPARAEVTKVSIPRKPNASDVLTGGVLGMIGGAVAGSAVGYELGSNSAILTLINPSKIENRKPERAVSRSPIVNQRWQGRNSWQRR